MNEVISSRSRSAASLFSGTGEVRAIGRELDWAATSLGPVEQWPQSLRSTVRILLSSQYPMVLTWGPQFTQIYNDAYSKLIGVSLVLALHELATNATKYGALSNEGGSVSILCKVVAGDERMFQLVWQERNGPLVVPPTRKGFGTRLVQRGLAAEFGGDVALEYRTDGLICTITAPLENMVSPS